MQPSSSTMPTVKLGSIGPVGRVALGTMQFAGSAESATEDVTWGAIDLPTATATVQSALDAGITLIDCAEAYGKGNQAERTLGAALAACTSEARSAAVLASKFGKHAALWETESGTGDQVQVLSPSSPSPSPLSLSLLSLSPSPLFALLN